jgi:DNA polymerase III delta subunit
VATGPTAPLGYYWGDDTYGVVRGPDGLAKRLAAGGELPERVRLSGRDTTAAEIGEKAGTATMFGSGTLVVVVDPAPLVASKELVARLRETLEAVAPGNGLAFLETVDGTSRRTASVKAFADAIAAAGGEVREFKAPKEGEMARWIQDRAAERAIRISPPAATVLARRVGAFVREGDIDRRRQAEIAVGELEKLALYRLDAEIRPEDVEALVADAVPGTTWGFLDAIGMRNAAEAARLADLLGELPGPVLTAVLHRRLKELVEIADLLAAGESEGSLVRTLKLNPYRARILAAQARNWTLPELESALEGLLELDATLKGREGGGDARRRPAVDLWIAERIRRRGGR